jgi:DNA-binding transcriptional ArsR family regulator
MAEHMQQGLFAAADTEALVDHLLQARRFRETVFNPRLFSDPAWDLLLNLYQAQLRNVDLTVDQLVDAVDLSPAVTARWLKALAGEGLTREKRDSRNPGHVVVELTGEGVTAMRRWAASWLSAACEKGPETRVAGLLDRLSASRRS